jgi:uncharacterized protein (TIGR01569 family)
MANSDLSSAVFVVHLFDNFHSPYHALSWLHDWFMRIINFLFYFLQAFTYLILGAGAVVTEVLYLAYKGDEKITWFEICPYYGRFCNRVAASLVISFLALLCFIPLSLISAYRVFSKYDPPSLCKKDQITSQS